MYTLGINAAFHDPAACLVQDGRILAAAEEERFTHIKHGKRPVPFSTYELPFHAIDYCLREAGIRLVDVDHLAYSFDPWLLAGQPQDGRPITLAREPAGDPMADEWQAAWEPLFLASIINAPHHLSSEAPFHLQDALSGAGSDGPYRWHFVNHHVAHAASAFYASPFQQAAVLTLDGRGERATTAYHMGHGNRLEEIGQVELPHSLGLMYADVTRYLGFLHCSDEYKVMALAGFGKPCFVTDFRDIVRVDAGGQYTLQPLRLDERFGPARCPGGSLEQRHYDIAHSLQVVLEETVLELVRWLNEVTSVDALCLAGGVALNCVLNSRLRDSGPFRRIWVQLAAGDAGTPVCGAFWVGLTERRSEERPYSMDHAFLGPAYSDCEIEQFLRWSKLPYQQLSDVAETTADLLVKDKVIGWFQGRMEFGPRALGARSILASPLHVSM